MRDVKRIRKFCNQLADLWESSCPDWRFGQLVLNVNRYVEAQGEDLFDIEEEEMIRHLTNYLKSGAV